MQMSCGELEEENKRLKEMLLAKDSVLEHALNRLETIEIFSGRKDFDGVKWESGSTQTRIKMALKLKV